MTLSLFSDTPPQYVQFFDTPCASLTSSILKILINIINSPNVSTLICQFQSSDFGNDVFSGVAQVPAF
jgi:hypothetical protein